MSEKIKLLLLEGVIMLIVAIGGGTYTYYLGKGEGSRGKQAGFDAIPTQVNLDKTKWQVSYEEANSQSSATKQSEAQAPRSKKAAPVASPSPLIRVATVEFNQYHSRIFGTGYDQTGRKWIIEGATSDRRVCYIYLDPEGNRVSFGTVLLERDNTGDLMTGKWLGWSPESNALNPRRVTLTKLP